METEVVIVNLLLLSEACSDAQTCLVPNDQGIEESLNPGSYLETRLSGPVPNSDVADSLSDTDTNTVMDTVNWVKTVEF